MTEEELKQKCTERAKIFQQAMESCHSSSPIDCIEWFADKIADLEKQIAELEAEVKEWKDKADLWCKTANLKDHNIMINKELEKENAELKAENQKWKAEWQEQVQKATDEGYARTLQTVQLTKAKELLERCYDNYIYLEPLRSEIAQFLSEVEK